MIELAPANGLRPFLTEPEEDAIDRTIARLEVIYDGRALGSAERLLLREELDLLHEIRTRLGRSPSGGEEDEALT